MDGLFDFFSREAGQRRRRELGDAITYMVPPELRGLLGLIEEMTPIRGAERAGQGAQRVADPNVRGWDKVAAVGDTLSETASVVAPVAAAKAVGMPAVQAIEEALLNWSSSPQAAGLMDFAADEFGGVPLTFGKIADQKVGNSTLQYRIGDDGVAEVFSVRTPQSKRGQGSARNAMQELLASLDEAGVRETRLIASPLDGKTSTDGLVNFYRSLGFEPTGEAANMLGEPWMSRRSPSLLSTPTDPAIQRGFRAFHGSPHDFDRFDMSKIGTGEGAQAYGHGLYFAENENIARSYRDALSPAKVAVDGRIVDSPVTQAAARFSPSPDDYIKALSVQRDRAARNLEGAVSDPELGDLMGDLYRAEIAEIDAKIAELKPLSGGWFHTKPDGRMYEVQINADPNDFLDWDKPLSEQPQNVREWFDSRGITPGFAGNQSGAELMMAERSLLGPEGAMVAMRDASIPGIKYFDHGSRFNAMDGIAPQTQTRNYVVFDDKLIDIVRKYGIAGAAALYGVSAMDIEAAMAGESEQGLLGQFGGGR